MNGPDRTGRDRMIKILDRSRLQTDEPVQTDSIILVSCSDTLNTNTDFYDKLGIYMYISYYSTLKSYIRYSISIQYSLKLENAKIIYPEWFKYYTYFVHMSSLFGWWIDPDQWTGPDRCPVQTDARSRPMPGPDR